MSNEKPERVRLDRWVVTTGPAITFSISPMQLDIKAEIGSTGARLHPTLMIDPLVHPMDALAFLHVLLREAGNVIERRINQLYADERSGSAKAKIPSNDCDRWVVTSGPAITFSISPIRLETRVSRDAKSWWLQHDLFFSTDQDPWDMIGLYQAVLHEFGRTLLVIEGKGGT